MIEVKGDEICWSLMGLAGLFKGGDGHLYMLGEGRTQVVEVG